MRASDFFSSMEFDIASSSAWHNKIFSRSSSGPWSVHDLRILGPEYYAFTKAFPIILSKLMSRVDDEELKALLAAILHSELGSGRVERSHPRLFERLLKITGVPLEALSMKPKLATTSAFLKSLMKLYSSRSKLVGLGAQYALEFQADNMLRCLSVGFRKMGLPADALEFFSVHEEEEVMHINVMRVAILRLLGDGEDIKQIRTGANECVSLFGTFWQGLSEAIPPCDHSH